MLKGTRAAQTVVGLLVIFFAYLVSSLLQFETLNWIISKFYSSFIIVVIVLFQDDIRRLLTRFGRGPFSAGIDEKEGANVIAQVIAAASYLSHERIGALIVFERGVGLDRLYDRSVPIGGVVTEPLLISIFQTFSPLHDGAVIIRKNRLECASAHLPLSKSSRMSRKLGTRHSAALGISEETDAVVLIVSEETGAISIAQNGVLESQSTVALAGQALSKLLLPLKERPAKRGYPKLGKNDGRRQGELSHTASTLDEQAGLESQRVGPTRGGTDLRSPTESGSMTAADSLATGPSTSESSEHLGDFEVTEEKSVLEDVRKLAKLTADDKFRPPVLPVQPPVGVSIGGVRMDYPPERESPSGEQTKSSALGASSNVATSSGSTIGQESPAKDKDADGSPVEIDERNIKP